MFVSVSEIKHQSSLSSSCLCVFFISSSRNKKKVKMLMKYSCVRQYADSTLFSFYILPVLASQLLLLLNHKGSF